MKKVLIVDDSPTVLKIVEFVLLEEGYEVEKAINADQALDKVESVQIDIGIFDINMPGKNGIELTKEVLETTNGKNMKIIILTTESSDDLKSAGREAGAVGWLLKPFQNEELVTLLKEL